MTKKSREFSPIAQKILADYVDIVRSKNRKIGFKPLRPSVKRAGKRQADRLAAHRRQANDLFVAISAEFGLDQAQQTFKDVLRGHAKRGKQETQDSRDIKFALAVHVLETDSPRRSAESLASILGTSVSTLESRFKRMRRAGRKFAPKIKLRDN